VENVEKETKDNESKENVAASLKSAPAHAMERYKHALCDRLYQKEPREQREKRLSMEKDKIRLLSPNKGLDEDSAEIYIDGSDLCVDIVSHEGALYTSTAVGRVRMEVDGRAYLAQHLLLEQTHEYLYVHAIFEGGAVSAGDTGYVEVDDCMGGGALIFSADISASKRA
jgi:hypothetical protein